MEGIVKVPELGTVSAAVSVQVVGEVPVLDAVGPLETLRLCKVVCLQDLLSPVSWLASGSVPKNASMKVDSRLMTSLAFVELSADMVDVGGRCICRLPEPIFDSRRVGVCCSDPPRVLLSSSGADAPLLSGSLVIFVFESSFGRRRSEGDIIPNSSRS